MLKCITLAVFLLGAGFAFTQPAEKRISRQEYIDTWKHQAQHQMAMYGIPASITLAQGILESANGNSALAKYANNHFGIKCHDWKGAGFIQDDDIKNECFRKYRSAERSFEDHSIFLTTRSRYNFLFDLDTKDYKGWAHGLKKAGYATAPRYAYLLIDLIEKHTLYQYDEMDFKAKPTKATTVQKETGIIIQQGHTVKFQDNGVKFVMATTEDTFYKICKEFELNLNQLYRYNDLGENATLHAGDIIYVQPKKGRSKQDTHKVKEGETLWQISQIYGIKLKKLCKKNKLEKDAELNPGDIVHLKKRKK